MIDAGRAAVLEHFRWVGGHADIWRVFADGLALRAVVEALVAPWRDAAVERVVGVESRGFLLGGACALNLNCGFVPIRKAAGLLPGAKLSIEAEEDYRAIRHTLRIQQDLLRDKRVLLVDDWAERGAQALAAMSLVQAGGGRWLGASLVVDQLTDERRSSLGRVTALVTAADLGRPDAEQ